MCATLENNPPTAQRRRGCRGFTLLELLVALLLLTIVATALYTSYFTVVRARDRALSGSEERRELQGTLDLLRREIAGALFKTQDKRLHFVVEDRDVFGKPASTLDLTAIAPPRSGDQPGSDLIAVRYAVEEREKDNTLRLTRQATDLYTSVKPIPYPQMDELQGFLVECYDGGKWVRSWNTALNPRLPEQVRITVTVKDGDQTADFVALVRPRIR